MLNIELKTKIMYANVLAVAFCFRMNPVTRKLEPYLPEGTKAFRLIGSYSFVLFMVRINSNLDLSACVQFLIF